MLKALEERWERTGGSPAHPRPWRLAAALGAGTAGHGEDSQVCPGPAPTWRSHILATAFHAPRGFAFWATVIPVTACPYQSTARSSTDAQQALTVNGTPSLSLCLSWLPSSLQPPLRSMTGWFQSPVKSKNILITLLQADAFQCSFLPKTQLPHRRLKEKLIINR